MTILRVDDFSVSITAVFLKLIGVWFADSRCERWLRSLAWWFTMASIVFGVYLQTTIIAHSADDFENCFFGVLNLLSMAVPMAKMLILLTRRKKFFRLILHMVHNFFNADYDKYETTIVTNIKRKCSLLVCITSCSCEICILAYVCAPLVVNLGKNESERILPFKMWVNVPLQSAPYFQIAYIVQTAATFSTGFAYVCIDNMLFIINLHLAGQFRILQYRLSDKYMTHDQNKLDQKSDNFLGLANNASVVFKSCIRQHQALIAYCEQLQEVFGLIVLVQVLAFSIFICLDGYQVLLVELVQRKVTFGFHCCTTVCQLVMFSYSCDCISQESTKLATAAYSGPWLQLPATKSVENLKKDLMMLIMRSNIPCCITGSGFFIVSLETCTRVLTTAGSYFTLLQQTRDEITS